MEQRTCKSCKEVFPLNRDFFGNTPSGNFRWKCRSCVRKHVKEYTEQNPEWAQEKTLVRQQRIAKAGGRGYTQTDVSRIRQQLGDRCAYCDEPLNGGGMVDHMTPVARGGRDEPENITLSCTKCNLAKHAKTVDEFIQWRRKRGLNVREKKVTDEAVSQPKRKLIIVRKNRV